MMDPLGLGFENYDVIGDRRPPACIEHGRKCGLAHSGGTNEQNAPSGSRERRGMNGDRIRQPEQECIQNIALERHRHGCRIILERAVGSAWGQDAIAMRLGPDVKDTAGRLSSRRLQVPENAPDCVRDVPIRVGDAERNAHEREDIVRPQFSRRS